MEETSTLETKMERIKKAVSESSEPLTTNQEAFLMEQALGVASQLEIPTATLVKKTAVEDAKKVVEFAEVIKELAIEETGDLVKATMEVKREKACSEDGVSEAVGIRGNSSIHTIFDNIIDLDSTSPSTNLDDIPLNRVYTNLEKDLAPSPSTKTTKKPHDVDASKPLSIDERIGSLVKRRIDSCKNLPTNDWLQPAFVMTPFVNFPTDHYLWLESPQATSDNLESTSSQTQPTTQTSD